MAISRFPPQSYDPYAGSTLLLTTRGRIEVRLIERIDGTLGSDNAIQGTMDVDFGVNHHISPLLMLEATNDAALRRVVVEDMVKAMTKAITAHIEKELTAKILGAATTTPKQQKVLNTLAAHGVSAQALDRLEQTMRTRQAVTMGVDLASDALDFASDAPKPKLPKYYASGIRVSDDDEDDDDATT